MEPDADAFLARLARNRFLCPPRTELPRPASWALSEAGARKRPRGGGGLLLAAALPSWSEVTSRHNFAQGSCWKDYERVPGTKKYADGSCRKEKGGGHSSSSSESDGEGGRRSKASGKPKAKRNKED